ncbi:diacylglycerol/lipid kinase family protein [Sphingomonas aracearum]|uniref:DAGKc domain-containing protein n=1 Tax=Sphingomonas aracearum TaxID=2283317 RepID=A0A369VYH5_9SPHN|nr:diacylglycerol kinase family protein [Sphingomonas aracearum]RDE07456.1 hypothetical protein DVW87_03365 [Sphingomonas aracearum]
MQKLWFITNPNSGSASREKCDALEAVFEERGLELVGRTYFPDETLPDEAALADVDTVVLFAGDGTINAAICHLADWDGSILILPGGTMNLLAKALHDSLDPQAIVHLAHEGGRRVALPFAEAGGSRALVGLILGPVTRWARAREIVREGRVRGLLRAVRLAWRRTFSRGIRVEGVPGLPQRSQAVFVHPAEGHLDVAAIDARDWRSILELGWEWLTGDWVAARAVTQVRTQSLRVAGNKPVLALFDGEPVTLAAHAPITGGTTRPIFVSTKGASA